MKNKYKPIIGFVGLGLMGKPMAEHIFTNGFPLIVYNRTSNRTHSFKKNGVTIAPNLHFLAKYSDIIITMVTGPEDVKKILLEKEGIASFAKKRLIIIDMSTIGPKASLSIGQNLQERGIEFLEAPVTGSVSGAESGTLTIFAAGEKTLYKKVKPVLAAMGKKIHYVGARGQGQAIKLINNFIIASSIISVAEGLKLGKLMNISPTKILKILGNTPGLSYYMRVKLIAMVKKNFKTAFSMQNMRKDLALGLKEIIGKRKIAGLARAFDLYNKSIVSKLGEEDISAIVKIIEKED